MNSILTRRAVFWLVLMGAAMTSCANDHEYKDYRELYCDLTDNGVAIAFSHTKKRSSRDFAVSREHSEIIIGMPNAKGIVKWDHIDRLVYREIDGDFGEIAFEFKEPMGLLMKEKVLILDFGIISKDCWRKIVDTVGRGVPTSFIPTS